MKAILPSNLSCKEKLQEPIQHPLNSIFTICTKPLVSFKGWAKSVSYHYSIKFIASTFPTLPHHPPSPLARAGAPWQPPKEACLLLPNLSFTDTEATLAENSAQRGLF